MRHLLQKWAELEPERCEPCNNPRLSNIFTIQARTEAKNIYDPDALSEIDLAWIQWAVQEAIVSRGWGFELNYNPDCPDPNNPYDATVDSDKSSGWGFDEDSMAIALLVAYLDTLEGER